MWRATGYTPSAFVFPESIKLFPGNQAISDHLFQCLLALSWVRELVMASLTNPISSLRSYCRIEGLQFHQRVIDETGLPHERLFHVQTIVTRQQNAIIPNLFDGFGHSIKVAKRNSALTALSSLNQQNELPLDASPRQDGLESILRLFDAELLPSKHSYADLVKLGRLFKVPIRLFKSGLDHCVSFCECKFLSPLGYQEASFKALSAIRALVEKMDEICIQSFVWKVGLLARLRGFSVSYEVMKHVSKSQFSASCVLFPLIKTEASAKSVKRAKELAARLMLDKFKSGDITRCSPLQNSIKPPTANRRGDNAASRGDLTYTGSLHPVERLELNQRINDEPPPVYTVEKLSPSIPASLSRRSGGTNKANHRSVKFRYFCRLGEMVIRGAACDNKRLAKRSAAERALQAIGISPYPHLARSAVSPPPALHHSAPGAVGRQQEKIEGNMDTTSKYHIGTTGLNKENCLNWKSEEQQLPSPRQEAVAWQLLSQLIRVLAFQRPNDNFSATAEFVSPDTQLLQMCSRFGIPCKLTELPGFKFTGGGAPVFQTRKFHNFVGLGCAFLLQIGGNHLGSLCLPSATGTERGYWTSSRGAIRLECQHNGRGGCFLSTAANRETCRRSLALYVLRGLPDLSE
ncbi:hypothetical protein EGR_00785 [Echinococcus granulosus]|uniref:DRBM domain-containing protein n=1 Tax=Echinococcus granulosus TaxID=6210 RepID=W6UUA8_ECHGR|nr:hypothetical protein EGR_00785 [Echinococcus granulosus]EUB64241.1 hypothetical protein EGR_00785 [Echinococcus granulosus]